jgi:hypothetical protein
MSKQDRQGVRTATDVERKYNLGKMSEYMLTTNEKLRNIEDILLSMGGGSSKEEQEKTVDITENSTIEVLPDEGKTLSKVTVNVDVPSSGTEDLLQYAKTARGLYYGAKSFSNQATVNLPNVTDVYQAFAYWNTEPIPIVEELTVNAPSILVSNNQHCMGQMFTQNKGVKKVTLNMPNECQHMHSTFSGTTNLEEIILNFSTENIMTYQSTFNNCKALKKIVGVLDFSSATNTNLMVSGCDNLEEVTFAPNTLSISVSLANSSKLTNSSKQSIFDGLAQLAEGVTCTITFHKDVKILQSQVDSANAKGWTVAGGTVVSEEEYYG